MLSPLRFRALVVAARFSFSPRRPGFEAFLTPQIHARREQVNPGIAAQTRSRVVLVLSRSPERFSDAANAPRMRWN